MNDQTDRLYLVSNDGMVECLREIGAKAPFYHQPAAPESESSAETSGATDVTTGTAEDSAAEAAVPADTDDPFGGAAEETMESDAEPAEEPQPMNDAGDFGVDDEDPFGNDE